MVHVPTDIFKSNYYQWAISILAGACIFNCNEDSRDTCEGFTEFICEEEQIFKVTQDRHQAERGFSKMRPTTRACRNARKTLNVQGNCCWKIYQRYRYAGDMRIIRGSRTFDLYFVPRSMTIMPCWNTYIPSTLAMMTLRGSRVYILDYFQMYFTFENILRIPKIDCISKCIYNNFIML